MKPIEIQSVRVRMNRKPARTANALQQTLGELLVSKAELTRAYYHALEVRYYFFFFFFFLLPFFPFLAFLPLFGLRSLFFSRFAAIASAGSSCSGT